MGARVGSPGLGVGRNDGAMVGRMEGVSDRVIVGSSVGFTECLVGREEGLVEGWMDGEALGMREGWAVGWLVG